MKDLKQNQVEMNEGQEMNQKTFVICWKVDDNSEGDTYC